MAITTGMGQLATYGGTAGDLSLDALTRSSDQMIRKLEEELRYSRMNTAVMERKNDYSADFRFVDDKVVVMVRSKSSSQYTEYIGDSIEHAMEKIKAHMVKDRMSLATKQEKITR